MEWRQQDQKDSLAQNTRTPKQDALNPKLNVHSGSAETQATLRVKEVLCRKWPGVETATVGLFPSSSPGKLLLWYAQNPMPFVVFHAIEKMTSKSKHTLNVRAMTRET